MTTSCERLGVSEVQMSTPRNSIKLNALRAQIKAGTDALERGDFIEVDDADLERYPERLTTPSPRHAR